MNLLTSSNLYKPFRYPQAVEYWRNHEQVHWLVSELDLNDDVKDWNDKLSLKEKTLCSTIFRFFTQGDILVADAYLDKFIPVIGKAHEVKRMMASFAGRETVHIDAYAKLIETLGMPDEEFAGFMEHEEMMAKVDYLMSFDPHKLIDVMSGWNQEVYSLQELHDAKKELAKTLAVYSAFMEGMQLFSSFAILMNFSRFGKMKGMAKVVEWSVRDELMHCEGMCWLFRTFIKENPEIWTDEFKGELYQICRDMVELEDHFIDLVFDEVDVEGLTAADVKQYIRFIADRRLADLGLKPNYNVENPLDWMDWMLMVGKTNFFEGRETEYTKGGGDGDDMFDD